MLVTALSHDADCRRALELGADTRVRVCVVCVLEDRFEQVILLDTVEERLP